MPAVVRVGDVDSGGGVTVAGISSVIVNGIPVCADGSPVSAHARRNSHRPVTSRGVGSVVVEGRPINVVGNPDTCGHVRVNGSPDVTAG